MRTIEVTVTYIDELLGTASADPDIHARFIVGGSFKIQRPSLPCSLDSGVNFDQ